MHVFVMRDKQVMFRLILHKVWKYNCLLGSKHSWHTTALLFKTVGSEMYVLLHLLCFKDWLWLIIFIQYGNFLIAHGFCGKQLLETSIVHANFAVPFNFSLHLAKWEKPSDPLEIVCCWCYIDHYTSLLLAVCNTEYPQLLVIIATTTHPILSVP